MKMLETGDMMNDYKLLETDSPYGYITIKEKNLNSHPIRILDIDGGIESASYVEEELQNELLFEYLRLFDLMFDENYLKDRKIKDVLLIGGGAFHYPKYFLAHHQGNIDVVEINTILYELSKKYFYLDKTIQSFDQEHQRLHYYLEDGRNYLNRNKKKYDVILSDVFMGENLVKSLFSIEAIKKIRESLHSIGMFIANIIGAFNGKDSQNVKDVVITLKQFFKYIYVFKAREKVENEIKQNLIVVALDEEVHFNIVSYHNLHPLKYHVGMINHLNDLDLSNGHILKD